jgi:anti-anti-sigma factor
MSMDFNVVSEFRDDTLVLKTNGYINNTGGEMVVQEFSKYPAADIRKLVVDLEKSKVINSVGISYLIEIIETVTQNNCKLYFTNLDPTIEKTFNIMGLFQFAEKIDSVESLLDTEKTIS